MLNIVAIGELFKTYLRNYKIKSKGVKKYVRNRIFIFSGNEEKN